MHGAMHEHPLNVQFTLNVSGTLRVPSTLPQSGILSGTLKALVEGWQFTRGMFCAEALQLFQHNWHCAVWVVPLWH